MPIIGITEPADQNANSIIGSQLLNLYIQQVDRKIISSPKYIGKSQSDQ